MPALHFKSNFGLLGIGKVCLHLDYIFFIVLKPLKCLSFFFVVLWVYFSLFYVWLFQKELDSNGSHFASGCLPLNY